MRDPWDEVQHPREAKQHFLQYIRDEVCHLNFYRLHMLYFILGILISSVIVYGEGLANGPTDINGTKLRYIDALFLCCSAMTTTGLNTVNLGALSAFQQAVLCILLLTGNVVFVSTFVVMIRRHIFRRKLADLVQHSRSGREILRDIEHQESRQSSASNRSPCMLTSSNAESSANSTDDAMRRRLICEPRHTSFYTKRISCECADSQVSKASAISRQIR